jgi:hypothetical protein
MYVHIVVSINYYFGGRFGGFGNHLSWNAKLQTPWEMGILSILFKSHIMALWREEN